MSSLDGDGEIRAVDFAIATSDTVINVLDQGMGVIIKENYLLRAHGAADTARLAPLVEKFDQKEFLCFFR